MLKQPEIARPRIDEYDEYYAGYVRKVGEQPLFEILASQHEELQSLLGAVEENRADFRYDTDKWSVKEVVGHLVDTERILAYRALCFARGEQQALPGFDQDQYVTAAGFDRLSLTDLLAEYRAVRQSTLALFHGLSAEVMGRRGTASDRPFTVRALAYIIAGHERHHLDVLHDRYGV